MTAQLPEKKRYATRKFAYYLANVSETDNFLNDTALSCLAVKVFSEFLPASALVRLSTCLILNETSLQDFKLGNCRQASFPSWEIRIKSESLISVKELQRCSCAIRHLDAYTWYHWNSRSSASFFHELSTLVLIIFLLLLLFL